LATGRGTTTPCPLPLDSHRSTGFRC
jgi:hypothetical protein